MVKDMFGYARPPSTCCGAAIVRASLGNESWSVCSKCNQRVGTHFGNPLSTSATRGDSGNSVADSGNKKVQHRGSVKTLALSEHGDAAIIAQIQELLHTYEHKQPYEHNVLLRIKSLLWNVI